MGMGFTLVELSIVLVIIGLIIGGVLVGRDLIKAAEIRSTISQIEKFNAATNTFRVKYNALPGDMLYNQASAFGFWAFSGVTAGTAGYGDGNGIIYNAAATCNQEGNVFWRHLTDANLVSGAYSNFSGALDASAAYVSNDTTNVGLHFPKAPIGSTAFYMAYNKTITGLGAVNVFWLTKILNISAGECTYYDDLGIPPLQAYTVDSKIDDGMPNRGTVRQTGANYTASATSGKCYYGGSGATDIAATYNTATGGDVASCAMVFKFQ